MKGYNTHMGLFSSGGKNDKYGIIMDIGSGSVLTAIVHSKSGAKHPTVVWAHREHTALKKIDSIQQSAKAVMTACMNASLKLDSEGRKILKNYAPSAKLTTLQTNISAPWSYTVTKTVSVKQEEPIEISEHLIEELISTAQKQVEEDLQEHKTASELDLTIIARATMDLLSNGYRVTEIEGQQAQSLKLTQATVVSQSYLVDELDDIQNKLFTQAVPNTTSFILMLYCTVRHLFPHRDEVCLIDVTDEATEIGIVRDGSLTYSTHTPQGLFTVAREIAEITKLPMHEAYGHLKSNDMSMLKASLTDEQNEEVSEVLKSYTENVTALFHETGDTLSIPKTIIVNTDQYFEPVFMDLIQKAANKATKIEHTTISLANEINFVEKDNEGKEIKKVMANDTALYLSAEFFHKEKHCLDFKYL